MEYRIIHIPPCMGQFIAPPDPSPNCPNRLNDQALMALPFIGMLVGVDEFVPTKAIYAVYDPSNVGLSYVHGDGTFVVASKICFMRIYKDPAVPLHHTQQLHLSELMKRSALHYHPDNSKISMVTGFATRSAVKASLTWIGELDLDSCPAFSQLTAPPELKQRPDQCMHHVNLESPPEWDFDTSEFQAHDPQGDDLANTLWQNFNDRYRHIAISLHDFQHAAFCLLGMVKAGLVSFLSEGQNHPQFFVKDLTPPLPPKLLMPRRTTKGWTADSFIARFRDYKRMFSKEHYVRLPSPIHWLEAEMENEVRLRQIKQPWILDISKRDNSLITWEALTSLTFETRGSSKRYTKPLSPNLNTHVISDKFRIRETKRGKQERKEKGKAKKRADRRTAVDQIGDHMSMGNISEAKHRHELKNVNPRRSRQAPKKSEDGLFEVITPPTTQKRQHQIEAPSPQEYSSVTDTDETESSTRNGRKDNSQKYVADEEMNEVPDGEVRRPKKKSDRKRQRVRSPQLHVPLNSGQTFSSPRGTLEREQKNMAAHRVAGVTSQITVNLTDEDLPVSIRFGISGKLEFSKTDSQHDVDVEMEGIHKKRQIYDSESKRHMSSWVQYQRKALHVDRVASPARQCDVFEAENKLAKSDPRFLARLRSPSSSKTPETVGPKSQDSNSNIIEGGHATLAKVTKAKQRVFPAATPVEISSLFSGAATHPNTASANLYLRTPSPQAGARSDQNQRSKSRPTPSAQPPPQCFPNFETILGRSSSKNLSGERSLEVAPKQEPHTSVAKTKWSSPQERKDVRVEDEDDEDSDWQL